MFGRYVVSGEHTNISTKITVALVDFGLFNFWTFLEDFFYTVKIKKRLLLSFFWTFGGFLGLGTFKPIWSNKLIQIPLF